MVYRRIRQLLWREDGAVTIFAVTVLSSLLLFFSLLIDYARIAALQQMTENGARSAVRSVLSAYDSPLYERYGLFGRGGTEGETIFAEVLKANISGTDAIHSDSFKLIAPRMESAELHTAFVLGDHNIFARQVLEEMKYKAPIDFTLELAAKFLPLASAMKEAHIAVELLEEMRQMYEKREAHLERAFELQSQAAKAARNETLLQLIPAKSAADSRESFTAESLIAEYGQYYAYIQHDERLDSETEPAYAADIADYEARAESLADRIGRESRLTLERHEALLSEAMNELEAAERINEQMKSYRYEADAEDSLFEGYGRVADSHPPGSENVPVPTGAADELEQVQQSSGQLIREGEWFAAYKREINDQADAYRSFAAEMGTLQARMSGALARPVLSSAQGELEKIVSIARQTYDRYVEGYIQPGIILERRKTEIEGIDRDVKAQLHRQESQADASWKQARQMLQSLTSMPQTEEHRQQFEQVRQRYEANLLYNRQVNAGEEAELLEQSRDAHEALGQSAKQSGRLFTGIADMLERARDTFYYGEYAIRRFTAFDPRQLRALTENAEMEKLEQSLSFHHQEAEYVLYGFHDPLGNLAAMYGELFAVRLAVRTMEGLIESRSLGHPLLILSAALIYGLEKTMEDLNSFMDKGSAPLSKYVNADLSYADYLRLFMLLHGGNEASRLARMIAVIEHNLGITLAEVPTGITGETRISLKLWFLPGMMRILGRFGLLQGKVVGSQYETTHTIGSSY